MFEMSALRVNTSTQTVSQCIDSSVRVHPHSWTSSDRPAVTYTWSPRACNRPD